MNVYVNSHIGNLVELEMKRSALLSVYMYTLHSLPNINVYIDNRILSNTLNTWVQFESIQDQEVTNV